MGLLYHGLNTLDTKVLMLFFSWKPTRFSTATECTNYIYRMAVISGQYREPHMEVISEWYIYLGFADEVILYLFDITWLTFDMFSEKKTLCYDDVIKWKHLPRYWSFVRGIHRSPVNSQHKGQWRGALMFSLICVWINGWINNLKAGDLEPYHAHYDIIVMH